LKATAGTLAAIVVLSLAVWTAFFLFMPQAPLTSQETLLVVGVVGVAVFGVRWVRAWFQGRRGAVDGPSK
jgi:hypothetical protein